MHRPFDRRRLGAYLLGVVMAVLTLQLAFGPGRADAAAIRIGSLERVAADVGAHPTRLLAERVAAAPTRGTR